MAKSLRNIMGAGVAPLMAQMINGTVGDGLVAAGTNQATALPVPADVNIFTTVGSGTGCILAPIANAAPGDETLIVNLGANALLVYPQTGGTIQGGSVNAGFSVPAGKSCKCICRTGSLNWIALLSA